MNYIHDIILQFLGIFIYPRNLAAKSNILNNNTVMVQACLALNFAKSNIWILIRPPKALADYEYYYCAKYKKQKCNRIHVMA